MTKPKLDSFVQLENVKCLLFGQDHLEDVLETRYQHYGFYLLPLA